MESKWMEWQGKKAHIILNNGYEYNCIIDVIEDLGNGLVFLSITDKFGSRKGFASGEIKFIEEKE